jgi:nitrogen fixation/metabolism regulation signal transduction histidine kinase
VLDEVVTTLRPLADGKGLTFELSMPAQDVMASTDRRAFSQILLNLTNNAIKFTDQGIVRLEIQKPDADARAIEIRVIDTGSGIKPEDQEKLFKAFAQVGTTGRFDGTGLCRCRGADMGSRILVIEDNPTNLELMTYLLNAFGHTTMVAFDGEEGVLAALRTVPDLILCDLALPKLDGYGVVKRLKADPRLQAVPLIAVTALRDDRRP